MSPESTHQQVAPHSPELQTEPTSGEEPRLEPRPDLAALIPRRFNMALPAINIVSAALTYVFLTYVLAVRQGLRPANGGGDAVLSLLVATGLCWFACAAWSRRTFAPVAAWLGRGGVPDARERARAVRFALLEAQITIAVWSLAGIAFCLLSLALGGSATPSVLVAVTVILGGIVASALCYVATDAVMRPAVALALQADPPESPLLPGTGTRIYLAWECGTAVAVWGVVVVATAYLLGADISAKRLAVTVIFLGGLALTVGLLTMLAAIRSVSRPLRGLRGAMAQVEEGNAQVGVSVDDGGEIGLLQAGFNHMVAGLRERDRVRDLFGRHVGEDVARSALRDGDELGGELREAAVLFVDLIGSTAYAAAIDPDEVVATLNRFFGIVVEVVTLHGGWVNKFEGDAALCAFGAPTDHPDPAGAALAAGRELRRRLANELDGLDAAIGLSAGEVVAGNVGAAQRYEYTVVGDAVNEAARLTELAKLRPSRLLASETIVQRASTREAGRWQLEDAVTLRGRSEPTQIAAPA